MNISPTNYDQCPVKTIWCRDQDVFSEQYVRVSDMYSHRNKFVPNRRNKKLYKFSTVTIWILKIWS